jgi:predicted GNAT superfamily acetyltransferase
MGAPTDRFIAQWWMRSPRVESLLIGAGAPLSADPYRDVPCVNETERRDDWIACAGFDLARREPKLAVAVPARFTDMLARRPEAARAWRMASREIFLAYLARGYRVTGFSFAPDADRGVYLLEAGAA